MCRLLTLADALINYAGSKNISDQSPPNGKVRFQNQHLLIFLPVINDSITRQSTFSACVVSRVKLLS